MSERRHKFSLRFKSSGTEAHFVKSHSEQLLQDLFWLALACALVISVRVYFWTSYPAAAPAAGKARLVAIAASVAALLVALSTCIATKMPRASTCVTPEAREVIIVLVAMFMACMVFLSDVFYGPKFLGYDPEEVWPPETIFSDTRPVLVSSLVITLTHLTLPIRWIVLLPLEAFSIVAYAVLAFVAGGPEGVDAWFILLTYACLVLSAAIGRRSIENHQRDALSQLIVERSLRAESEFRLGQTEQDGQPPTAKHSQDDQPSVRESRPETTDSGMVFLRACEDGDLKGVIEVGKREQWLIDPQELDLMPEKVVGNGGFGTVVAGHFAGTPVAVKMVHPGSNYSRGREHWQLPFLNEIRVLRRLRHPNIVLFCGASCCSDDGNVFLILEWVHGPCLERFVLEGGVPDRPLRMTDQLVAVTDTCRALFYLHSRQPSIVHGDLKGDNIIMERSPSCPDSFRAKLLDFGLARVLTKHVGRMGGTVMWVAPEVVQTPNMPAHGQADVFSFGRLSFFVLTGVFPFGRCYDKTEIRKIVSSGSLPPLPWPPVSSPLITEWHSWIEACSACDPTRRPTLGRIRAHVSDTLRNFGLEVAPEALGFPPAAQQDEADSDGAAAWGSCNHMTPEALETSPTAQDLTGLATIVGL